MKLNLMKEIAEQHKIEWDPESTELEFSKVPQDLLVLMTLLILVR